MKAFFDFGRVLIRRVKTITVLLAALAAVATGCGKSNTSAPAAGSSRSSTAPTASSSPAATASTASATSSQPATTAAPDESTRNLQMLNRALMQWMIKNRRHPQTFEEFANSANFQIPDPPAGKKYALGARGFIVLVDNQ